jgi:predicted flap endonuclease-1-like 5' DNA nuclease
MVELFREYLPVFIVAVLIAVAVGYLAFRPRQRVRLTDTAPVRPHMAQADKRKEGRGLAGEAAAAASDVTGELLGARVHHNLSGGGAPADDFTRLKGVGPKFAAALNALGFDRYEQLARLTPAEIERIDPQLGAFRGRIVRDQVIEQADYLARNDIDGYEGRFGKL